MPQIERDKEGRSQLVPGKPAIVIVGLGGINRVLARMQSMSDIAHFFDLRLGYAVKDETGLTGRYDFVLEFAKNVPAGGMLPGAGEIAQASTPAPDLVSAVRRQLGLKLQSTKEENDVLVVDSFSRAPTAN